MKKYFELLTIPIAILLLVAYNELAEWLNVQLLTWEKIAKLVTAIFFFLVAIGFVRIVFALMMPIMYKYFDLSFSNAKLGWNQLSEKQRLVYSSALFCALFLIFAVILNAL